MDLLLICVFMHQRDTHEFTCDIYMHALTTETPKSLIESTFIDFTQNRTDISVILITQNVSQYVRNVTRHVCDALCGVFVVHV